MYSPTGTKAIVLLSAAIGFLAGGPALAESEPAAVCIYASQSYSNGAMVCAQKALMLTCQTNGARPTWAVVTDKELSNRCSEAAAHSRTRPRVYASYRRPRSEAIGGGAKCFEFNGKRYCE